MHWQSPLYADPHPWLRHVAYPLSLALAHCVPGLTLTCTSAPLLLHMLSAHSMHPHSLCRATFASLLRHRRDRTGPRHLRHTPRVCGHHTLRHLHQTFRRRLQDDQDRLPWSQAFQHTLSPASFGRLAQAKADTSRTAYRSSYQTVYLLVSPQLGDRAMSCSFRSFRAVHPGVRAPWACVGTLSHPPQHAPTSADTDCMSACTYDRGGPCSREAYGTFIRDRAP